MTLDNLYGIFSTDNTEIGKFVQIQKRNVYLRIVDDVKRKIELGLYSENEQLPSCRELALNLGINPNTVQRAYATLESEGFIYTMPKKGVYVSPRDKKADLERIAEEKLNELKQAGIPRDTLISLVNKIYGDNQ